MGLALGEPAIRTVEPAALERQIVPILGMHRSGTSMLTRMLQALGLELGGPLQGPAPDNPRGFWEHRFVQQLNMRLLSGCGCDPDGLDQPDALRRAAAGVARYAEPLAPALGRFLDDKVPGGAFGFKDPRTAITLPFWQATLARLGIREVRPIVVVRHPLACARSLSRRGDPPRAREGASDPDAFWLSVWATYYALLAEHVPADALWLHQADLSDPQQAETALGRCAAYLGLRPSQISPALATLEPDLLHHRGDPDACCGDATIDEQYAALCARARACTRSHPTVTAPRLATASKSTSVPIQGAPDCIYVVTPPGYAHSHGFDELALGLHHGLADLGVRAPIVSEPWQIRGCPLVLGPQLLAGSNNAALPDDAILYNLEQVSPGSPWFTDEYRGLLQRHRVWDYSPRNLDALTAWGVPGARLCRPGHHPALHGIAPLPEAQRDIDVLFYGSLNGRRRAVLEGLSAAGLSVVHLFGIYGAARDRFIQRAKLVLNVHHYSAQVLEMVRIGYLLNNGICVVSEPDGGEAPDDDLHGGLWLAAYDGLVEACHEAIASPERRATMAAEGARRFAQRPQSDALRHALSP